MPSKESKKEVHATVNCRKSDATVKNHIVLKDIVNATMQALDVHRLVNVKVVKIREQELRKNQVLSRRKKNKWNKGKIIFSYNSLQ